MDIVSPRKVCQADLQLNIFLIRFAVKKIITVGINDVQDNSDSDNINGHRFYKKVCHAHR